MALSSHMNNNRLSSNILPASPAAAGVAQTTNLDSTLPTRAAQLLTVRPPIEDEQSAVIEDGMRGGSA